LKDKAKKILKVKKIFKKIFEKSGKEDEIRHVG